MEIKKKNAELLKKTTRAETLKQVEPAETYF